MTKAVVTPEVVPGLLGSHVRVSAASFLGIAVKICESEGEDK
jgi:hypothetical protein